MPDTSELPRYIDRPGGFDPALAGPYTQMGVNARAYLLRADKAALTAVCDRYLNLPGTTDEYQPLLPLAIFTMMNMSKVSAGDASLGFMHEIDGGFILPVLRKSRTNPLDFSPALFMPYLWVNNHWPMVTGREVFGFRKEVGLSFSDFDDDDQVTKAAQLSHIDAFVVPKLGAKLEVKRLVEVDASSLAEPSSVWRTLDEIVDDVLQGASAFTLQTIKLALSILNPGAALHVPVVFLKQIRDAYQPDRACFQEVFRAGGRVPLANFSASLLSGQHWLTIHDYASHPLVRELGLENVDPAGRVRAALALETNLDFDVDLPRK
jgi:hypothetical protein